MKKILMISLTAASFAVPALAAHSADQRTVDFSSQEGVHATHSQGNFAGRRISAHPNASQNFMTQRDRGNQAHTLQNGRTHQILGAEKGAEAAATEEVAGQSAAQSIDAATAEQSFAPSAVSPEIEKISVDVRTAIQQDPALQPALQTIEIVPGAQGVLFLRGTVATEAEKTAISDKARLAPGVTQVDNQIEVRKA